MPSGLPFLFHVMIFKWLFPTIHGMGNDAAGSTVALSFFSHTSEIETIECHHSREILVAYVTSITSKLSRFHAFDMMWDHWHVRAKDS